MREKASVSSAKISIEANPSPVSEAKRKELLANPGFGRLFTDHMVMIRYADGKGWHDAKVMPYGPLQIDPACAVLHYGQEIFEGLKAYRLPDGGAGFFRPEANAQRFQSSARRLAMPEVPIELFLEAQRALVKADSRWIPEIEGGSLYLRPFMFASEVFLGVKPSSEYIFLTIASPVGAYFKGGAPAVSIWVSDKFTRAGPGGTGEVKCGGNYAASLLPQAEAIENGCDQVVFLDAVEHKYIDELGGMNVFFVFDDGSMVTPELGTILPGITRDSILTLVRDAGIKVRQQKYSIDQWKADAASGRLREAFACGTAAVIAPIGSVKGTSVNFVIGNGGPGILTEKLKAQLTGIQRGTVADPHGWLQRVI
jgi:branched-chain amino acid aminotransferase